MSEKFKGLVEIQNAANARTIGLDGDFADLTIGGNGLDGDIMLQTKEGSETIHLVGKSGSIFVGGNNKCGELLLKDQNGEENIKLCYDRFVRINPRTGEHLVKCMGKLALKHNGEETLFLDSDANISIGGNGKQGKFVLNNANGKESLQLDADANFDLGGEVTIGTLALKRYGVETLHLDADANIYVGGEGTHGTLILQKSGKDTLHLDGWANIFVGGNGVQGDIVLKTSGGQETLHLDGNGNIKLMNQAGNPTMHLEGETGDIKLIGADCAEEFDIVEIEEIDHGTVLVIGDESKLEPCKEPYDKKVAGVVSGGNGSNPGIILGKSPTQNKRLPIALNGKVYCKVDAQYSPIEIGDLLTTSPTDGHAMKAIDHSRAFGAVIGKALEPLCEGAGMIPILVALQ